MAWVLAIMLFMTVLATAAGVATAAAAGAMGRELAGRATVQIATADAVTRAATEQRVVDALRASRAVRAVRVVPRAELTRILGPWLGDTAGDGELPIPALIDIDLADRADALPQVRALLARIAPAAQVDRHGDAMASIGRLLTGFTVLSATLVVLMAVATAAVVILAARAGLEAHRTTIEVMHALGATDVQVARLFQRRLARDASWGALFGGVAGWLVVALAGSQIGAAGSQLLAGLSLGREGWVAIALLPVVFVLLAAIVARRAVLQALGRLP